MTPIDIHDPVHEICYRLGMPPHVVAAIHLTPSEVEVTTFRRTDAGKFFIEQDNVATRTHTFEVTT